MNVANAITQFRLAAGRSKRWLAAQIDVDRSYVTHLEAGRRTPSLQVLARIALALGVTTQDLVRSAEAGDGS
jgi:transcriptional regulator with XRE-family HTH domain